MKFDLDYLEKIAKILYENDLSEITIEEDKKAICLKREKQIIQQGITSSSVLPSTITSQVLSSADDAAKKKEEDISKKTHKGKPITAPMVGTFYASPAPDEAPFVKIGDSIAIGQVVCIIEAMKLMNEIETEVSGKITEICVNNGDNVEFGQVLMYVE